MCRKPKPSGRKEDLGSPNQVRHQENFSLFGGGRVRGGVNIFLLSQEAILISEVKARL